MLHLVYFAPENLSDPVVLSDAGAGLLVCVLRSLLQNCLLLDFTDYRFDDHVAVEVEKLPHDLRKIIKTLLAQFKKGNRIVRALEDNYVGSTELHLVAKGAEQLGLELLIIRADAEWHPQATRIPRTSLAGYPMTDFETHRSRGMADQHFGDDGIPARQFIDVYIVPFVRFAERLDLIDGSLGENYRDDYGHTLDCVFAALGRSCHWKERVQVTVHCCRGKGNKPDYVRDTVLELAKKHGLGGRAQICFYGKPGQPFRFKHDRCLASEFGVLNIGRGFDFVQKTDGKLRNTVIGFGGPDADTLLGPYADLRS